MSYLHVLVAIDFSEISNKVIRHALDVAGRFEARITLLHVVDYVPPLGYADDFSPTPLPDINEEELIANAERSLAEMAERHGLDDSAERIAMIGAPKEDIIRIAAEHGADLIVIGSHGVRGLDRLLGTTARAVLNDAVCDVLAVRVSRSDA